MRLSEHIRLVTEAFDRGLLDIDTLIEVTKLLSVSEEDVEPESLWLNSNRFAYDTLHQLKRFVSEQRAEATRELATSKTPKRTERPAGVGHEPTMLRHGHEVLPSRPRASTSNPVGTARASTVAEADEEAARLEATLAARAKAHGTTREIQLRTTPEFVQNADADTEISDTMIPGKGKAVGVSELRYEPLGILGTGGLSQVNECLDTILRRKVAVKVPRGDIDERGHALLEREARIIAGLEHPNIIPAYDAGYQAELGPYYVMRKATQPSLDTVLKRLKAGEERALVDYGRKPLLRYFVQICNAIEYANQRGVVHCDLKPGNILLGEFGEVLVVDWGLAYSRELTFAPRGGTPGYMAPEQLTGLTSKFDGRTDVFALGALLYHLLALKPAFPDAAATGASGEKAVSLMEMLRAGARPPSEVSPELDIEPELDEICMKALAFNLKDRHQSARELGDDIVDYLEGRKEEERRRAEADRCSETGDELAARYYELVEARPEYLDNLRQRRQTTPPWAPIDAKASLWDTEDMVMVTDSLCARTLQAAIHAYEQALESDPVHRHARAGLIGLYRAELQRARRERHEIDQIHYEQLLRQLQDDAALVDAAGGTLTVVGTLAGLSLTLRAVEEDSRRLVLGEGRPIEGTPGHSESLSKGAYVLEVESENHVPGRFPFVIEPGSDQQLEVDLPLRTALDDGEVFIPAGPALLGHAGVERESREPREVYVAAFAMARFPVTFRQYLSFVAELMGKDRVRGESHLPRTILDRPRWIFQDDVWQPVGFDAEVDFDELLDVPVFGITADDAAAYAAWLSTREGRDYRLPTDSEWEKAARGTDGRIYPWGNHFDPTFCKMRHSRAVRAEPEVSGRFEVDESPYGVRDMAGGIADWVIPDEDAAVYRSDEHRIVFARGGAWCDWPDDCRADIRRTYLAHERGARVGFRLARSL